MARLPEEVKDDSPCGFHVVHDATDREEDASRTGRCFVQAEAWNRTHVILEVEPDSQPAIEAGLESASNGKTDCDRGGEWGRFVDKIATESQQLGFVCGIEANHAQAGAEKGPYPALIVRQKAHEIELNLNPQ